VIVPLPVPYRNTRAADLSWSLDVPDQPALHRQVHSVGPLSVEVRILGASHQIVVRKDGLVLCRETVACCEGNSGPLPLEEERELDEGYLYEVRCGVRRLDSAEFPAWARALKSYSANRPGTTISIFPDIPDAITAVAVETLPSSLRGVLWRTWHTYPDPDGFGRVPDGPTDSPAFSAYGEVVTTRTLLHRGTPL
jgi:hypothetical protein